MYSVFKKTKFGINSIVYKLSDKKNILFREANNKKAIFSFFRKLEFCFLIKQKIIHEMGRITQSFLTSWPCF